MDVSVVHLLYYPLAVPGGVSSMIPSWISQQRRMGIHSAGISPTFDPKIVPSSEFLTRYSRQLDGLSIAPNTILHAHHPLTALTAHFWRLCRRGTFPIIFTIHGWDDAVEPEMRLALKHVDAVVAVSRWMANTVHSHISNISPGMIYNGVDLQRFYPAPLPDIAKNVHVITVARLVKDKGIDTVLKVASLLNKRAIPFVWCIVGDGPERAGLASLARVRGLQNQVQFVGWSASPEKYLQKSHVFVLPTHHEAFGNAFVEANLCGLPTIGPDLEGIPEHLQHGRVGFLTKPNDTNAMVQAIQRFYEAPALWHLMRMRAIFEAQQFGVAQSMRHYLELYRTIGRHQPLLAQ